MYLAGSGHAADNLALVPLLLCLAFVLFVVVVGLVTDWRRRRKLADLVGERGWRRSSVPKDAAWVDRLPGRQTAAFRWVLEGEHRGYQFLTASYMHKLPGADGGERPRFKVAYLLHLVGRYPAMAVLPRGDEAVVTGYGPAATGDPRFDSRWVVTTDDPEAARALLTPGLVAAHIDGRVPGWSILDGQLMSITPGSGQGPVLGDLGKPENVIPELDRLILVADELSRHT